jgi:DNA-binding NarL/FixJ family response regulator
MDETRIRVLIADDHGILSESLRLYLENAGLEVLGVAATGRQTIKMVQELQPDVLLLDIRMPDLDGLQALSSIKSLRPDTTVIMLTSVREQHSLARAIALGAAGYLLKDTHPRQIPNIIQAVLEGDAIVDQSLLRSALTPEVEAEPAGARADLTGDPETTSPDLTAQETRVLRLVAEGMDNDAIAEALVISPNTVKTHVTSVFRKLGVSNRTQAAVWAIRNGMSA